MNNFVLKEFPQILSDINMNIDTKEANLKLAKYDGMIEIVPYPEILTSILFYQESVMSSRLEGTIATITDILNYKVGKNLSERLEKDVTEIENYKDALGYCIKEAEENNFEITNRLIKNIQAIILNNSRGGDKLKGKYKEKQNYIGNKYDGKITYTPVSYLHTDEYMNNLIKFINSDFSGNLLIKVAIIHAYFELIHPFEDGNGRVGRILIPILLKKYNVLSTHYFYISYYFSINRTKYISSLEKISKDNDWQTWINFFVDAIEQQTSMLINVVRHLQEIRKKTELEISGLKTQFCIPVLNFLFKQIKFNTTDFIEKTGINSSTARSLLRSLEEKNIIEIEEKGSGHSPSIYKFKELYNIVEEISA
jgi:Fic family protein